MWCHYQVGLYECSDESCLVLHLQQSSSQIHTLALNESLLVEEEL